MLLERFIPCDCVGRNVQSPQSPVPVPIPVARLKLKLRLSPSSMHLPTCLFLLWGRGSAIVLVQRSR